MVCIKNHLYMSVTDGRRKRSMVVGIECLRGENKKTFSYKDIKVFCAENEFSEEY